MSHKNKRQESDERLELLLLFVFIVGTAVGLLASSMTPLIAYADVGAFLSGPYSNVDYGITIHLPQGYPAVESHFKSAYGTLLAVTVGFKSNSVTSGYDLDGATMDVIVVPSASFPIPSGGEEPDNHIQTGLDCHVSERRIVVINEHIKALKLSSTCVGFDSDTFSESFWIQGKDKVVEIQYEALDDYAYRLHLSEFQKSLGTINLE